MSCQIALLSTVGIGAERGGRSRNEDNYLICDKGQIRYGRSNGEHREAADGKGLLVVVCDGMGGHNNGDLASATAVRVLSRLYAPIVPSDPQRVLRRYVLDSHRDLYWRAHESAESLQMGTTLTALWIFGDLAYWLSIGDSRLYSLRDEQLTLVSSDQTRNEFARRDGLRSTEDGVHLAQSFIYGSRGLGDNSRLRLEAGLDYGTFTLKQGDRLLLCSDGLSGVLDSTQLRKHLTEELTVHRAVSALVSASVRAGSRDNVTALVVQVDSFSDDNPDYLEECDDESTMFF